MRTLMGLLLLACLSVSAFGADKVQIVRLPEGAVQPQAVVDRESMLHVVYLGGEAKQSDVYYVRSTDEGATFSEPVRINNLEKSAIAIGAIRGAQVAVSGAKVHVVWNGNKGGMKTPLFYARSDDGGKTFTPQRPITGEHPGMDGGGSVAADETGRVVVAWHAPGDPKEEGEDKRRIFVAESTDSGGTFSAERAVDETGRGVCACCSIRAAFVKGKPVVFYRMARDVSKRNMVMVDITTGATHQLAEVQAGQCPMSTVSYLEQGQAGFAAWETLGKLEFGQIKDGAGVGKPVKVPDGKQQKHPSLAMNAAGTLFLAWIEESGWAKPGRLRWVTYDATGTVVGASEAGAPVLPLWSFPASFAKKDGTFVVLY